MWGSDSDAAHVCAPRHLTFLLEATVLVVRVLIEEFLEERFADYLDDGQGHLRISWHSCCQTFMRQRTDEH